jgi:hypothetical protein
MKSKKYFKNKRKQTKRRRKALLPIFSAAQSLTKTGSVSKAATAYKTQALFDARKLFGSVRI